MDGDVVASIDFMMECKMLEIGSGLDTLAFTPKAGAMNRYQTMGNIEYFRRKTSQTNGLSITFGGSHFICNQLCTCGPCPSRTIYGNIAIRVPNPPCCFDHSQKAKLHT